MKFAREHLYIRMMRKPPRGKKKCREYDSVLLERTSRKKDLYVLTAWVEGTGRY